MRTLFPAIMLLILAAVGGAFWMVHLASDTPPRAAYLVTPERLAQFTKPGKQFTDEKWVNRDETVSRGWLARGERQKPAIILLHRYGTDRSWLLNLGMKLAQSTEFSVLIPDLRGHGENPAVMQTSFGGCEADDLGAAVTYLRNLKNDNGENVTNGKIGVYGIEEGAIAAILAAPQTPEIAALALDSVPVLPGDILDSVVASRTSLASAAVAPLANAAAPLYFVRGCYKNTPLCESASALSTRKVLLLAGSDAPKWQESTKTLASCFTNTANVEKKLDLQPSGYNLINSATSRQQEDYNNLIVNFFRQTLGE